MDEDDTIHKVCTNHQAINLFSHQYNTNNKKYWVLIFLKSFQIHKDKLKIRGIFRSSDSLNMKDHLLSLTNGKWYSNFPNFIQISVDSPDVIKRICNKMNTMMIWPRKYTFWLWSSKKCTFKCTSMTGNVFTHCTCVLYDKVTSPKNSVHEGWYIYYILVYYDVTGQ